MMQEPLTDSHATLGALLRRPYETMSDWLYAELAASGFDDIRPAFSAVLRNLSQDGGRVSELATKAGITKQSMGYLVDQMAACGLVELAPDPHDGRAKVVRLTDRGTAAVLAGVELSGRYEAFLSELIGRRDMNQLRALLAKLHKALSERQSP